MAISANTSFLIGVGVVLLFIATPVAAFGAGDITEVASINNVNYRHGDIENTLLELIIAAGSSKKFNKLDVKRVYFGNWLRDYSQAIDVGGLKQLPAETIRILLWCLSFITFGYATGEFEVTADRLGCYRPEEHIDNPKDYADNEDARKYDKRLRGPVDEGKELKVDTETGLKVYIASEKAGVETSAGMVRKLFEKSIELGRKHKRDNNDKNAFYEALRLLGTGLHCLEDFSAHSNYTELALKELGVDAFPHVGKNAQIDVKGKKVFPLVTGTFGMTDFLHSLVGEMGDKVAQSEVEEMESKLDKAMEEDEKNDEASVLKEILDKVPWDMLEGDDKPDSSKADELKQASAAKKEEAKNKPLDGTKSLGGVDIEEAKKTAQQTLKDMYPILEFHDKVMKGVSAVTSKVPGLDDLLENMTGALQIFIFSLLAPYIKPIIAQARVELKSTSEGVLKTSMKGQYEVFENDKSTDPTHSMLSKDHFSNVLNTVAGQIACTTVKFVVPRIVEAWDDEGKDVRQVIDDILQVFHHPALRDEKREGQKAMFETVKKWWESKDESEKKELKDILSFNGVKEGKNHKGESEAGGHSHGAPPKKKEEDSYAPSAQEGAGLLSGLANLALDKSGLGDRLGIKTGDERKENRRAEETSSSGRKEESQSYGQGSSHGRTEQPSHTQETSNTSSYGRKNDNETSSYGRNDNDSSSYGGNTQQQSSYGRGNDNETSSYGRNDNETSSYGDSTQQQSSYGRRNDNETSSYGRDTEGSSYGRGNDHQTSSYGGSTQQSSYGRNDDNETSSYGRNTETSSYGRESNRPAESFQDSYNTSNETSSYGREDNSSRRHNTEETSYGSGQGGNSYESREEGTTSYGGRREESSGGYGQGREEETSYGRQQGGYGQSGEENSYSGRNRDEDQGESRRYRQDDNSGY